MRKSSSITTLMLFVGIQSACIDLVSLATTTVRFTGGWKASETKSDQVRATVPQPVVQTAFFQSPATISDCRLFLETVPYLQQTILALCLHLPALPSMPTPFSPTPCRTKASVTRDHNRSAKGNHKAFHRHHRLLHSTLTRISPIRFCRRAILSPSRYRRRFTGCTTDATSKSTRLQRVEARAPTMPTVLDPLRVKFLLRRDILSFHPRRELVTTQRRLSIARSFGPSPIRMSYKSSADTTAIAAIANTQPTLPQYQNTAVMNAPAINSAQYPCLPGAATYPAPGAVPCLRSRDIAAKFDSRYLYA